MNHGLRGGCSGVYQIRGLDIANMTAIEGVIPACRGGHADLDRRSARRVRALLKTRGQTPGGRVIFTQNPFYRTIGRRRAACALTRRWRAAKPNHRPNPSSARGFGKTSSRGGDCCGARNIRSGHAGKRSRGAGDCGLGKSWRQGRRLCAARRSHQETGDKRTIDGIRIRIQMGEQRQRRRSAYFFICATGLLNLRATCTA